jgi:hypothetical protein
MFLLMVICFMSQVRGLFGGGNNKDEVGGHSEARSETRTSEQHVSSNAGRTERKEVTRAYAAADVRLR